MKHLVTIILSVSATVLIYGCAKSLGPDVTTAVSTASGTPAQTPVTPTPGPQIVQVAGNWQFSAVPARGAPPIAIAGSLTQNGSAVSGILHVDGSGCLDKPATINVAGTVTADSASLAATGQALTFAGKFTGTGFAGTYTILGNCAIAEQGSVTGLNVPWIPNALMGTFTSSTQDTFNARGGFDPVSGIAQSDTASSDGSYAVTGTINFDTPCFRSGTLKPGTFASGSFILGTSLGLQFDTGNGTLTFFGTIDPQELAAKGNYRITGGNCDDSGTAVLYLESPWDY
jgi:hypothetical protein